MGLESWADSHIGLVRKSNQDAVGCFPELGLFVVADGMGGRAEGEVASRIAVDTIHASMAQALAAGAPRQADGSSDLPRAVSLANRRVYDAGHTGIEQPRGSMGTTVVALLCAPQRGRAQWAHVGDSRLYRVRGGELALLTADHTMFGEAFWGQDHVPCDLPHTNRLVRAVGIEPTVTVAHGEDELRAGDLFLLCSDGLSGMVTPADLCDALRDVQALADAGAALMRRALEAGGRDNASAVLVRV